MPPGDPYPLWLHERLQNTFLSEPRYENSYYGPIDGILNAIFPIGRGFMVKPQAIIRPSLPSESSIYLPPDLKPHPQSSRSSARIPDAAAKVAAKAHGVSSHANKSSIASIDSFGDQTLARSEGGWEDALLKPDFLVVKATASVDADVVLALVEVKLGNADVATSMNQVESYLDALQTKNYADNFVAFLSMGSCTFVWRTTGQGNNRVQTMVPQPITTGDGLFCDLLHLLRQQFW